MEAYIMLELVITYKFPLLA